MIILVNPRATRPKNRRFPLSVMAIGAVLPEGTPWEIVDGNCPGVDPYREIAARIEHAAGSRDPVHAVAMTVMPGPQLVSAVPLARRLKERFPSIPIVWGGYFPSLYPRPALNAPYVDWIVRGQGEQTFVELLDVLTGRRDPVTIAGLGFQVGSTASLGPERHWSGPDAFPPPPYAKIDVDQYLHSTFLGRRNAVYQTSIGCPYSCNFCGVISAFGSREKWEDPEPVLPGRAPRRGRRALLRQQLLPPRRSRGGAVQPPDPAGTLLVVRSPDRCNAALRRRHLEDDQAIGTEDGLFRRRVGLRRATQEDGEAAHDCADRGGCGADTSLRNRP